MHNSVNKIQPTQIIRIRSMENRNRSMENHIENDISVYICTFQIHINQANVSIKFPCTYYLEWKTIHGKKIAQSQGRPTSSQGRSTSQSSSITFEQSLQFLTEMVYNNTEHYFYKKQTMINLNLVSISRPDQVKLVGRVTVDLADIVNKNKYSELKTYKLTYCSVDADLQLSAFLINKKQSQIHPQDLDKSAFNDYFSFYSCKEQPNHVSKVLAENQHKDSFGHQNQDTNHIVNNIHLNSNSNTHQNQIITNNQNVIDSNDFKARFTQKIYQNNNNTTYFTASNRQHQKEGENNQKYDIQPKRDRVNYHQGHVQKSNAQKGNNVNQNNQHNVKHQNNQHNANNQNNQQRREEQSRQIAFEQRAFESRKNDVGLKMMRSEERQRKYSGLTFNPIANNYIQSRNQPIKQLQYNDGYEVQQNKKESQFHWQFEKNKFRKEIDVNQHKIQLLEVKISELCGNLEESKRYIESTQKVNQQKEEMIKKLKTSQTMGMKDNEGISTNEILLKYEKLINQKIQLQKVCKQRQISYTKEISKAEHNHHVLKIQTQQLRKIWNQKKEHYQYKVRESDKKIQEKEAKVKEQEFKIKEQESKIQELQKFKYQYQTIREEKDSKDRKHKELQYQFIKIKAELQDLQKNNYPDQIRNYCKDIDQNLRQIKILEEKYQFAQQEYQKIKENFIKIQTAFDINSNNYQVMKEKMEKMENQAYSKQKIIIEMENVQRNTLKSNEDFLNKYQKMQKQLYSSQIHLENLNIQKMKIQELTLAQKQQIDKLKSQNQYIKVEQHQRSLDFEEKIKNIEQVLVSSITQKQKQFHFEQEQSTNKISNLDSLRVRLQQKIVNLQQSAIQEKHTFEQQIFTLQTNLNGVENSLKDKNEIIKMYKLELQNRKAQNEDIRQKMKRMLETEVKLQQNISVLEEQSQKILYIIEKKQEVDLQLEELKLQYFRVQAQNIEHNQLKQTLQHALSESLQENHRIKQSIEEIIKHQSIQLQQKDQFIAKLEEEKYQIELQKHDLQQNYKELQMYNEEQKIILERIPHQKQLLEDHLQKLTDEFNEISLQKQELEQEMTNYEQKFVELERIVEELNAVHEENRKMEELLKYSEQEIQHLKEKIEEITQEKAYLHDEKLFLEEEVKNKDILYQNKEEIREEHHSAILEERQENQQILKQRILSLEQEIQQKDNEIHQLKISSNSLMKQNQQNEFNIIYNLTDSRNSFEEDEMKQNFQYSAIIPSQHEILKEQLWKSPNQYRPENQDDQFNIIFNLKDSRNSIEDEEMKQIFQCSAIIPSSEHFIQKIDEKDHTNLEADLFKEKYQRQIEAMETQIHHLKAQLKAKDQSSNIHEIKIKENNNGFQLVKLINQNIEQVQSKKKEEVKLDENLPKDQNVMKINNEYLILLQNKVNELQVYISQMEEYYKEQIQKLKHENQLKSKTLPMIREDLEMEKIEKIIIENKEVQNKDVEIIKQLSNQVEMMIEEKVYLEQQLQELEEIKFHWSSGINEKSMENQQLQRQIHLLELELCQVKQQNVQLFTENVRKSQQLMEYQKQYEGQVRTIESNQVNYKEMERKLMADLNQEMNKFKMKEEQYNWSIRDLQMQLEAVTESLNHLNISGIKEREETSVNKSRSESKEKDRSESKEKDKSSGYSKEKLLQSLRKNEEFNDTSNKLIKLLKSRREAQDCSTSIKKLVTSQSILEQLYSHEEHKKQKALIQALPNLIRQFQNIKLYIIKNQTIRIKKQNQQIGTEVQIQKSILKSIYTFQEKLKLIGTGAEMLENSRTQYISH